MSSPTGYVSDPGSPEAESVPLDGDNSAADSKNANGKRERSPEPDEDLVMGRESKRKVWLVKVPKFLMDQWASVDEDGVPLGTVRVYEPEAKGGENKIALLLNERTDASGSTSAPKRELANGVEQDVKPVGSQADSEQKAKEKERPIPTTYDLRMTNKHSHNLYAFAEKPVPGSYRARQTYLAGTISHECGLTPRMDEAYRKVLRTRSMEAAMPRRTVKVLEGGTGTSNLLAAGAAGAGLATGRTHSAFIKPKQQAIERFARMPSNELMDLILEAFGEYEYWPLKGLRQHLKQPEAYLKEVLSGMAQPVKRGPYSGLWALTETYKDKRKTDEKTKKEEVGGAAALAGAAGSGDGMSVEGGAGGSSGSNGTENIASQPTASGESGGRDENGSDSEGDSDDMVEVS